MASILIGVAFGQVLAFLLLGLIEFLVPAVFWYSAEVLWRRLALCLRSLIQAAALIRHRGGVVYAH